MTEETKQKLFNYLQQEHGVILLDSEFIEIQNILNETPDSEILQKAIDVFGRPAQQDMVIEEMSELTKAILKYRKDPNMKTYVNVLEEMADVEIMMQQMRLMFPDLIVDTIKEQKIERLKNRLEKKKQCSI